MSATSKRAALAGWLEGQTATVRAGLHVEERFRAALLSFGSVREIRALMGDPIYYADVLVRGGAQDPQQGRDTGHSHTYDVRLWYEYEDASAYASSSQKTFDDLCYGPDGIIPALLDAGCITHEGQSAALPFAQQQAGVSDEVRIDVIHDQPRILAHLLTFTVQLT